jgi:hypothetical protein
MKRSFFTGATGILALTLFAGCRVATPAPIADSNVKALPEPISYYGEIELFDEKSSPLAVMVSAPAASDETSLAEYMKSVLNKSDITCVQPGQPCDIRISVDSSYQELTAAPQCRLSHLLTIAVSAPDGTGLQPAWEHKTETTQAYPTTADAKNKLLPLIKENIRAWEKAYFSNEAGKVLKVSVVRFKMSRNIVELNPIQFEKDLRRVLNRLRKITGVVDVRMIEADKESRIASFRVLYRKDIFQKERLKKQK